MKMTKYRRPQASLFNTFFDDVLTRDHYYANRSNHVPAANVKEDDNGFTIELAAPGMNKGDFEVHVEQDVLTLSAKVKSDDQKKEENYTRREFRFSQFTRSFKLPETVDTENISARYKDGVLSVSLPKNEKALIEPVRQIKVG